MFSLSFWMQRPEEFTHFLVIILVSLDEIHFKDEKAHKIIAALLVLASCRIMMHTIAREPNMAIFVEMVSTIQVST